MATKTTTRIDHSTHGHAMTGAEGKKARAKCRREMEEAAKKAAERKPRPRAARKESVSTAADANL